jgi:hypothetical protein
MNIDGVMNRIKNLQEYEIQVPVPKEFHFTGSVPYDIHIVGSIAFVTLVAETFDEAKELAYNYFYNNPENLQ